MQLFVNKIISSIIEIILFALIPFIWWIVTARKKEGFLRWIGLKRTDELQSGTAIRWTAGIAALFLIVSVFVLSALKGVESAASDFDGLGAGAIPAILVYACLNTSLPEEILFRGFLCKRMSARFGFTVGNIVQAALFGLLHGVMFFSFVPVYQAILIISFTGIIACFMGYINENKAGGSIFPSWVIHALANIFSGLCAAFGII